MMDWVDNIEDARQILLRAWEEHKPRKVFCLFSGGHDSLTATHAVMTYLWPVAEVVHIDTGIGIPETQQFVVDTCQQYGWPLHIYRAMNNTKADGTPDPMVYDDIVRENGFPGPGAHRIMYSKLKQRQVRRLVRDHKKLRSDRIMLISGARLAESSRRMGNAKETSKEDAQVWVNPMLYLSDSEQHDYMVQHQLPRNPVKDKLCMSGECLCGAYAHPGELREIEYWYPEVGQRIRRLEEEAEARGWVGDWEASSWGKKASQLPVDEPMCVQCNERFAAGQDALNPKPEED